MCFDMPPQVTCASGKMGKHKNHIFHSNAALVESAAAAGLCCTHTTPVRCLLKEKWSTVMCLIPSNIC